MAGISARAQTGSITTGTSAITLLQVVAATNTRVVVKSISVSFAGTSPTAAPILVDVLRQSTAGTMMSLTVVKEPNLGSETIQTTAQHTAEVEPTAGDVVAREYVHPQTGVIFSEPITVLGGTRLGVRVTAAASTSAVVRVEFEE